MKKFWKQMSCIMLAVLMLVTAAPVGVYAENEYNAPEDVTVTWYPKTHTDAKENKLCFCTTVPVKATGFKSSNTSVLKVKVIKEKGNAVEKFVYAIPKKAGKATISFKYEKKTYRFRVTVKKYASPVSYVKIGSKKISAAAFKNTTDYTLKYSDYADKETKVQVKCAKGWSLRDGIAYGYSGSSWDGGINNGGKIKVEGGSGFWLGLVLYNEKTRQREQLDIWFK